jgi:hypothetical protein
MENLKKNYIDDFIFELEKYYLDCSNQYFTSMTVVDKLNEVEIEYLNENINLQKIIGVKTKNILNETLKDKSKNNFTSFLINSKNIKLELNLLNETRKTLFIQIFINCISENSNLLLSTIGALMNRGYIIKEEDEKFVNEIYKTLRHQKEQERWYFIRFVILLKDGKKFNYICQKQKEMFILLSLKLQKPIHFNFTNLIGVLNNAFQYYRESGDIFLKAIKVYKLTEKIQILDSKNNSFKRKVNEYIENKPFQNKDFEDVVKEIFPELK